MGSLFSTSQIQNYDELWWIMIGKRNYDKLWIRFISPVLLSWRRYYKKPPPIEDGYLLLMVLFRNQRAEKFRVEGTGRNTDVMLLIDRGIGDLKEGVGDI